MCLKIEKGQVISYAENDITVYKVLYRTFTDPAGYRTLYRDAPVNIGETYESELLVESFREPRFDHEVHIGLHSFASILDAMEDGRSVIKDYDIIKCTIPKGSGYYVGSFNHTVSYASDKLRYDELLLRAEESMPDEISGFAIEWKNANGVLLNNNLQWPHGNDYEEIAIKAGLIKK